MHDLRDLPRLQVKRNLLQMGIAQVPADRRNDAISRAMPGSTVLFFDNSPKLLGSATAWARTCSAFCGVSTAINRARTLRTEFRVKRFFQVVVGDFDLGGDELPQGQHRPQHLAAILLLAKAAFLAQKLNQRSRERPKRPATLSISADTSASVIFIPFAARSGSAGD